ncbi:protein FAM200A-like [Palaemon carinicauda]|uniref:protein FAM200A-like n=1 Tax=Palaemon carinicauda TaxID=392227 RepID=UPI0035B5BBEB
MIKIVNHIQYSALNTRLFMKLCQDLETEHETLLFHTNVRWLSKVTRKRHIQKKNTSSFPRLIEILNEKSFSDSLKTVIKDHLQGLENEFQRYFPNIGERSFVFNLARDPFSLEVDDIPEDLQEQFLELKSISVAKDDHTSLGMEKFWIKYLSVYQKVSQRILQVIVPFSSTYLCEAGFSALVGIKTKKRNKLDVASDLRFTLSQTPPNIPRLVALKSQYHPSH